jgi:hypothetical protein
MEAATATRDEVVEPTLDERETGATFIPSQETTRALRHDADRQLREGINDAEKLVTLTHEPPLWDAIHEIERTLTNALDAAKIVRATTPAPDKEVGAAS